MCGPAQVKNFEVAEEARRLETAMAQHYGLDRGHGGSVSDPERVLHWAPDSNIRLSRAVEARRMRNKRTTTPNDGSAAGAKVTDDAATVEPSSNSSSSSSAAPVVGGADVVDEALTEARAAYEALRDEGKLVVATFKTMQLGLSLVLSRFAKSLPAGASSPKKPRRVASTPTFLPRSDSTSSSSMLETTTDPLTTTPAPPLTLLKLPGEAAAAVVPEVETVVVSSAEAVDHHPEAEEVEEEIFGRSLVLVDDTFPDRGGGVARALLRPMDELVAISTLNHAEPELIVDLDISAFHKLLVQLREYPRPLTLIFARGKPKTAVRRVNSTTRGADGRTSSVPTRRRRRGDGHFSSRGGLHAGSCGFDPRFGDKANGSLRLKCLHLTRSTCAFLWWLLQLLSCFLSTFVMDMVSNFTDDQDLSHRNRRRRAQQQAAPGATNPVVVKKITHRRTASAPLPVAVTTRPASTEDLV